MPYPKKYSDEIIIESYNRLNNVWLVAEELGGICGQSVWERVKKLGVLNKSEVNNPAKFRDWKILKEKYPLAVTKKGGIEELAKELGRTKQFICRKAKEVGLTNISRKRQPHISELSRKRITEYLKINGHPKGYKGMKHTEDAKKIMSKKSKLNWENPDSIVNSPEHRQKLSDRMMKMRAEKPQKNPYSRTKSGKITIDGRTIFMRSSWEANVAAYLQFLKQHKQIKEWEYEPETFWFLKIKRGVRSYKPDFKITNNDDTTYFIEVKGWMDAKSKTKLKRMKIYYPQIKIELIEKNRYKEICKNKALYRDWGKLD